MSIFFRNTTQRIELIKWLIDVNLFLWLIELNLFLRTTFQFDSKCWTLQITERIELFFEYNSKNWTLFLWIWRKELNPFLNMTQWIELFLNMTRKNWTSFWVWFKELNLFLSMTQKYRTFFFFIRLNDSNPFYWMWLKNWNFGWKNSQKIQNCFLHDWKNRTRFFQYDSKNWTFSIWLKDLILFSVTPRIELFWLGLTELDPFSWIWLRELKISWFFFMSPRIELFSKMTQRIEPFFLWIWRKELNLFSLNVMSRIWIFLYDAKNWTLLFNMTHSIEPFFSTWLKEWIFFLIDSKKIEPCVKRKVSKSGTFFFLK